MSTDGRRERGLFSVLCLAIGGLTLLIAAISVINTAFELDLALEVSGASTPLPKHWDATLGLAAVGALIVGLTLFGGLVADTYRAAEGEPLRRVGIVVGALALLVLAGRGLQVLALVNTYGSMLAYYATDGDLEDVKAELAKGASPEELDAAVSRAAQYDNAAALALLLDAGADMRDVTSPEERRSCALLGRSVAFVKTALDRGVTAASCANGEHAIWAAVRHGDDDATAAELVGLLRGAGWSVDARPSWDDNAKSAAALAEERGWAATIAALQG